MAAYSHSLALADVPPADVVERSSALLSAIAHPKRLALVAALARRELCVCELVDLLGMPQPLVSHHLAALRAAGLVRDRRDAHWVYYSLVPQTLDEHEDAQQRNHVQQSQQDQAKLKGRQATEIAQGRG